MPPTDVIRVAEALRRTGFAITSNHVTRMIRSGRIPAKRIGGHWYVRPADLTAALLSQEAAS
jgi:excisionase family DNA binding protein